MSRRFTRLLLLSGLILSSEVWAIGLGEINLDSALNEPLRAKIFLLSASDDELADLSVILASEETFTRYGIDRPLYLQGIEFEVVQGGPSGNVVQIRSRSPIAEPFLKFLVEATWASGRLLREYTVLLDPPTYAAPIAQQVPAVEAPRQSIPSDSGRIQREPAATPSAQRQPVPEPEDDDLPYDANVGDDMVVSRGDTLWGIASRTRSDLRLSMSQTMLAIFEANPEAFAGNINMLKAGATLRIPSADEVFQINRGDAFDEVQRQHSVWNGDVAAYVVAPEPSRPSLTLVPPDEDPVGGDYDALSTYEPQSQEQEIEGRISELEAANVSNQQSLIEIRDNELASLRQELANIRGEIYEPPVESLVDDTQLDDEVVDTIVPSLTTIRTSPSSNKIFVDKVIEFLTGFWGIIIGALILVMSGLIWFMRRGVDDNDRPWEMFDSDEIVAGSILATPTTPDSIHDGDAMAIVEQDSGVHSIPEDMVEAAINLDQSNPIAEADFHIAYGLYDQAADLINGALELDPSDKPLMSKLCEIYFVWGNRDAFISAATKFKANIGGSGSESVDWGKIVIMGQQIATDHEMFEGVELGAGDDTQQGVDFDFDFDVAGKTPTIESTMTGVTAETNLDLDDTIEQPRDDATVEQSRPTLPEGAAEVPTTSVAPENISGDLHDARTIREVGTKLDLARAYVDMGDAAGARSILEEVLDEGDDPLKQQAQQLLDSLPS
ncbi:MAG: LysM peptidoglycan-binding domain-containing protein [Woeseiaceae bacterium]|nr:LysM peptidoglycan-binding domain-containing protein [Woeseiaceae bacterium]